MKTPTNNLKLVGWVERERIPEWLNCAMPCFLPSVQHLNTGQQMQASVTYVIRSSAVITGSLSCLSMFMQAMSDLVKSITALPLDITLITLPAGPLLEQICIASQRQLTAVWLT